MWGSFFFAREPFLSGERKGSLALSPKESRLSLSASRRAEGAPGWCSYAEMRRFLRENPFFLEKERVLSRSLPKKAAWLSASRRAEGAPGRCRQAGDETKQPHPPPPPGGGCGKSGFLGRGSGGTLPFSKGRVLPASPHHVQSVFFPVRISCSCIRKESAMRLSDRCTL